MGQQSRISTNKSNTFAHDRGPIASAWGRLSATQRIMARGVGLVLVMLGIGAVVGGWAPSATASDDLSVYNGTAVLSEFEHLRSSLDSATGELELVQLRLARAEKLIHYSARYRIPADLAELVYDVALAEGIDPEMAFRLVNLESGFNVRATSIVNAIGLAQVMLKTARFYVPDITVAELYEPETNLRIGFRYLRDLLETYGDVKLALLAYNRGPARVRYLMRQGEDPENGYASTLMKGYEGTY